MADQRRFVYTPVLHKETGGYLLSDDPALVQEGVVHQYLACESYWAKDIPLDTVRKLIAGSLCVGVYHEGKQVAFARAVTDGASFAYLADVFVLEAHRKKGLSKRMVEALQAHPDLQGLRRWLLVTYDAHGLYQQYGFQPITRPENFLTIHDPDLYLKSRGS